MDLQFFLFADNINFQNNHTASVDTYSPPYNYLI